MFDWVRWKLGKRCDRNGSFHSFEMVENRPHDYWIRCYRCGKEEWHSKL